MNSLCLLALSTMVSGSEQYFVQLKAPTTVEALLNKDDRVLAVHHLRPYVKKAFSFGKFEGFVGSFGSDVLMRLRKNPWVEEVTSDVVVRTCDVQVNAPRHLARLSSRDSLQETLGTLEYKYPDEYRGQGINAYVIDTGIECGHAEFQGRCEFGVDITGEGPTDMNGHGTHVAGIIGSKTYGVAKDINLVAVKALDKTGTGSLSSIIAGIEFAVKHQTNSPDSKGLINSSIGAFRNSVSNHAVEVAYDSGLVLVAAAGNSNIDACATSPASAKHAITVGAIDDRNDNFATFSNWGRCVNVSASGVKVASVNAKRPDESLYLSGTSMSTPVVSGSIGIMLSAGIAPDDVKQRMKDASTVGAVPKLSLSLRPITPNRIAHLPMDVELEHTQYVAPTPPNGQLNSTVGYI